MKLKSILLIATIILCACEGHPSYHSAPFEGNKSEIDISNIKENEPEFYASVIDGKTVSFFLLKKNDGIQSYFNACRECYSKKLGFRFNEGYTQCKACNVKYPPEALKEGIGSCYPIRLKGALQGGKYIITREAMMEGLKYF